MSPFSCGNADSPCVVFSSSSRESAAFARRIGKRDSDHGRGGGPWRSKERIVRVLGAARIRLSAVLRAMRQQL